MLCLALMGSNFTDSVREAHRLLELDGQLHIWEPAPTSATMSMPSAPTSAASTSRTPWLKPDNRSPSHARASTERKLRRLDCAVLNWYLDLAGGYQTVRGCFLEGPPVFPGAALLAEAHIQLAVRDPACIIGTFSPTLRS